jgi:tRNA modification GTPase
MDTIFAPATARGRSGVAVIRLSGPRAWDAVARLAGELPAPRVAALRKLRDSGELLDEGLVVLFAEGASFTGEQSAELHLHGAPAVVSAVLRALGRMEGLVPAAPGAFTRRALENSRLDLAQVEGLADLIEAETEGQRRQALRVLSGAVGAQAELWRRDLIGAMALIEATIDFADEDVPVDVTPEVSSLLGGLLAQLQVASEGVVAAERVREGFEVAIVGLPNVGKSTLLNRLAGREAAITSERAGTTRDVIEVRMDIAGLAVTLLDTAGLREASDPIERMGVDRAMARAANADLRIWLTEDVGAPPIPLQPGDLVVRAKADLHGYPDGLSVSGVTGAGLDAVIAAIAGELSGRVAGAGVLVRARHQAAVVRASRHVQEALDRLSLAVPGPELVAYELLQAARALDSLVGRVDVEALLDDIFARFCIGK